MTYTGVTKPTNKIVCSGEPPIVQELKVETATNMYPGRLAKKGTNDDDIVVNTAAGAVLGWIGFEQTAPEYRPATVDTIYTADDQAAVLSGGGFLVVGRLASGQNVTKGTPLVGAANGELTAATQINIETGSTAVTSSAANGNIIDGSLGEQGLIVAIVEESVDASAAAADIVVRSLI